ncbi:MAG: putative transrane protein [Acidimicrobiaceae bacterium]|nr:putative transrane protein [Acidimicrobiaceae bacterium]
MPRLGTNESDREARVVVGLALDPPRHSRGSVAVRGILTIPLFVVAVVIGVAAGFMSLVAWFAALFTGRVPDGVQEFLVGALRFYANLLAYAYYLTPRWPGIAFSPQSPHQVTLEVDHVKLRRAAVFFRIILGYPANLVNGLLVLGALPVLVVMWLWGIVAGREPRALHQALALVLRYQIRFEAYGALVTPTQPFRGLFGDGVTSNSTPDTPTALLSAPLSVGSSVADLAPVAPVDPATSPLPTRWFVSKVARAVVIVILVLGVPVYIGVAVAERPLITKVQDVVARSLAASSYATTVKAMGDFERSVRGCATSTYVGCAARAATTASQELTRASTKLADSAIFPSNARGQANLFVADLDELESEVTSVQFSSSVSTSMNVVQNEIPLTYSNFKSSYRTLKADLSG